MPTDPNRRRVAIRYTADDGFDYQLVTSRNHAIAVNAVAPLAASPPLPTRWVPRLVYGLQVLGGRDRTIAIVAPDPNSALWLGSVSTIDVAPYGTLEITGRSGEGRTQGAPGYNAVPTPPNERVSIKYRSSNGSDYSIVTTRARAACVGAESGSGFPSFPEVWTPRHYILISPDLTGRDQKAILIEPNQSAAAWVADEMYVFPIGPNTFNSTGRRNEKRPRPAPPFTP